MPAFGSRSGRTPMTRQCRHLHEPAENSGKGIPTWEVVATSALRDRYWPPGRRQAWLTRPIFLFLTRSLMKKRGQALYLLVPMPSDKFGPCQASSPGQECPHQHIIWLPSRPSVSVIPSTSNKRTGGSIHALRPSENSSIRSSHRPWLEKLYQPGSRDHLPHFSSTTPQSPKHADGGQHSQLRSE